MNEQEKSTTTAEQPASNATGQTAQASVEKEKGANLPARHGSQQGKALATAKDRPEWFSSVSFDTRNDRLELMRLEGKRDADHAQFKAPGQLIKHLIRIPYEYVDKEKGEEVTIPRYLCQTYEGQWLNVFSDGMVRQIDKLVNTFGLPPWDKPFRFTLEEIPSGKPSPFLSLKFSDA